MVKKNTESALHTGNTLAEQVAAEQQNFGSMIREQLENSPWWVTSIALHFIAGIILMLIFTAEPNLEKGNIMVVTSIDENNSVDEQQHVSKTDPKNLRNKISETEIIPGDISNPTEGLTAKGADPLKDDKINIKDDVAPAPNTGGSSLTISFEKEGLPEGAKFGPLGGNGKKFGPNSLIGQRTNKTTIPGGEAARTLDLGLEWLAKHQEENGSWKTFPTDPDKKAPDDYITTAVTGFAVCAFLGRGHTEKYGRYKHVVRKGLQYLKSIQSSAGAFSSNMYAHGIATLAVADSVALGGSNDSEHMLIAALQNAADRQHKTGGWDYSGPRDSDSSVTGFMAQAIHTAMYDKKFRNMALATGLWEKVIGCFHYMRTPDGSTGYRGPGGGSVRLRAVGSLMALFNGEGQDNEWIVKAVEGLPKTPDLSDMYGTYYQTLVKYQMIGSSKDKAKYKKEWAAWTEGLGKLIEMQVKDGENKGSWFFSKNYGNIWGRTGDTAISCLCIELRYPVKK